MWKYLISTVVLGLVGCSTIPQPTEGGALSAKYTTTTTTEDPETGHPIITTDEITATVDQPENPSSPAGLDIIKKQDGSVRVQTNTSAAQNNAADIAEINLLKLPMYIGAFLIIAALAFGYFTKNIWWAAAIGITGIGMIIGAYLLAQYAVFFLLGLGVLVIAGGYLLYSYLFKTKALTETVNLIDAAKQTGAIDSAKLKELAENTRIRSKKTKRIIDNLRT